MADADDDWRLTGQEKYLLGVELVRKPYRARSASSEHDHCSFCWAKFMDPILSAEHRPAIADDPEMLTEGYATTETHAMGADYYWICPACFDDFVEQFSWRLVDSST
jgi:hypothetical protein